jgi:hypothetical protein
MLGATLDLSSMADARFVTVHTPDCAGSIRVLKMLWLSTTMSVLNATRFEPQPLSSLLPKTDAEVPESPATTLELLLQSIVGVSANAASAIAETHGSLKALRRALKAEGAAAVKALSQIKPPGSSKRVGPVVAERIRSFLMDK